LYAVSRAYLYLTSRDPASRTNALRSVTTYPRVFVFVLHERNHAFPRCVARTRVIIYSTRYSPTFAAAARAARENELYPAWRTYVHPNTTHVSNHFHVSFLRATLHAELITYLCAVFMPPSRVVFVTVIHLSVCPRLESDSLASPVCAHIRTRTLDTSHSLVPVTPSRVLLHHRWITTVNGSFPANASDAPRACALVCLWCAPFFSYLLFAS